MDTPEIPRKTTWYNIQAVFIAAIGSVIYGYNSCIFGTTVGQPEFYNYFGLTQDTLDPAYSHTSSLVGACNGVAQAGGFFGCFLTAWISERWGRVACFQVASALCLIGGAIQSAAQDMPTFLVFRFINGVGVGMCQTATPLYQAELSPPHSRGVLVGCHGAFLAGGSLVAGIAGLGCFFAKNPEVSWRLPLALQALAPLALLVGSFYMPQSPRWLVAKGHGEEARSVLQRLHNDPHDPRDHTEAEFDQIVSQIQLENDNFVKRQTNLYPGKAPKPSLLTNFKEIFTHAPYRRRAALGFGIMFGAQCTGVLVINNYQVTLYPKLGVSDVLSLVLYVVYLVIALIGNAACGTIVDKFGRLRSLQFGLAGCFVALTGECISAHFANKPGASSGVLTLGVFFIFLYIPFFGACIDPNMYIYSSEIFPADIRSVGMAVSMSGQWLATICFLQSAPTGFNDIGSYFYIVFIICTVLLSMAIYLFYPETKGLSLEEMAGLFHDEVAVSLPAHPHPHGP